MSPVEPADDCPLPEEGVECTLDMFREYAKVKAMLLEIPDIVEQTAVATAQPTGEGDSAQFAAEKAFQDLKTILDQYQEQPHLLDPHLEELLGYLISLVREAGVPSPVKDVTAGDSSSDRETFYRDTKAPRKQVAGLAFQYIYLLVKVRGYKVIINKLPHEVPDLLPVLEMLEAPYDDRGDFYNSYVLLLWLSIIVYMPFNIADFDATSTKSNSSGSVSGEPKQCTVVQRLLNIIERHLQSPQASRDMAAFLASKLLTRPDLRELYLPQFVQQCVQVLESTRGESDTVAAAAFHRLGSLRALGLLWKHGRRDELLPLSAGVMAALQRLAVTTCQDSMSRKLAVKLVQRIGLTFLPPRLATWRYHRGNRSLLINVNNPGSALSSCDQSQDKKDDLVNEDDEDDMDVAPEMEDVIDELLKGLKDTDTVVRWSSSKGVGRVCGRLSRSMAGEVVAAVLSSFTPRDSHNTWHGGCLALAELGRRGLLLPDLLPEVVDVLQKAFVYDKLMGQCSVGANIRDAACYLCWSLARAYDPLTLQPYVNKLATGLIIVALFDREIPCRHAAAAAFQEHVGRQGSFPHGIEILTTVDYFAVGIRANSYLKLGPFVASFPEYSVALVDHLVEHKLTHWDTVVRDLAAKTLKLLTQYCVEHCSEQVLGTLLAASSGPVLVARHGAILALGNVISALVEVARQRGLSCTHYVDSSVISSVCSLVGELQGRGLLLGVGGSYMRLALADLVQHVATARVPVPRDTTEQWLSLLEESVVINEEDVRGAAVKGLAALWGTYYGREAAGSATEVESHLLPAAAITRYLSDLSCERESHAQGMATGLGVLPLGVLQVHGNAVLRGLLKASVATPETARWAATRRDAISSVVHIVTTLGLTGPTGVSQDLLDSCLATLLVCLEDYTTDRRGDVGAWVREGAVTAIQSILQLSVQQQGAGEAAALQSAVPSAEHVSGAVTRMVQLAVERIDRTRRVAGTALAAIIHSQPPVPHIPQHEVLLSTLPPALCSSVNWGSDRDTFQPLSCLLQLPDYRPRLIMGLAYSLGGVSANLAQSSSDALDGHVLQLSEAGDSSLAEFVSTVLELLQTPALHDRLQLPLLKTLEHFMTTSSLLDQVLESDEHLCQRVLSCLKAACQGCHDYHRLVAISATLSELLRLNSTVTKPLLNQLLLFLGYQYPKVRTVTATTLLTALQDYAPDLLERGALPSQEVLDQLLEILEDTPWMEAPLPLVREKRNICCRLLGLPVPAVKKKAQQ